MTSCARQTAKLLLPEDESPKFRQQTLVQLEERCEMVTQDITGCFSAERLCKVRYRTKKRMTNANDVRIIKARDCKQKDVAVSQGCATIPCDDFRSLCLVIRQALLMIVRWIEHRYGLESVSR